MKRNRSILITILIALLALGLTERTLSPVRTLVGAVVYPVSRPLSQMTLGLRSIILAVRDIQSLRHEVADLTDHNQALTAQLAQIDTLRNENDSYRQALAFSQTHQDQALIASEVVGRSPSGFLESMVVNKGEADGVADHAPVIANGYLVGLVIRRTTHTATVQLITSSDSLVAVVFTNSRAQGLLHGGLAGLVVQDVALDAHVTAGEPLVTSALGGMVSENIPVGTAGVSRTVTGSILEEVPISTPVDIAHLELVFIGQPVGAAS